MWQRSSSKSYSYFQVGGVPWLQKLHRADSNSIRQGRSQDSPIQIHAGSFPKQGVPK